MLGLHGTKLFDYSGQQGSSNESRPPEELYKFRPCNGSGTDLVIMEYVVE